TLVTRRFFEVFALYAMRNRGRCACLVCSLLSQFDFYGTGSDGQEKCEAKRSVFPSGRATKQEGEPRMPTITTKDGTEIFYKDWGSGQPIVFHHGCPLSADDWDNQMLYFLHKGYRVIAHDRRGHGRSAQVSGGHDMEHYAADMIELAAHLDLKG